DEDAIPLLDRRAPLIVRQHPQKGRGVYASAALPPHTLLDVAPVLLMETLCPPFDHYTFRWPGARPHALALGIGSLLNHARRPNTYFLRDTANGLVRFYTMRAVAAGEELCISYGDRLWF
ncbi:hypothetical protein THASP1DRAFT_2977, partial [Thamnocephalis sphaerospora]